MFQQDENLPCLHFSLASLVFHEGTKPVNTVRLELPIFEALNMKRDLSDDEAKIISIRENSSRYLTLWWKVRKAWGDAARDAVCSLGTSTPSLSTNLLSPEAGSATPTHSSPVSVTQT